MYSVKALQELFNKALERINMDAVFMEDVASPATPTATPTLEPAAAAKEGGGAKKGKGVGVSSVSNHTQTTAYIFVWMLIMEAIRQCNPQVHTSTIPRTVEPLDKGHSKPYVQWNLWIKDTPNPTYSGTSG